MSHVFISYSSKQRDLAEGLAKFLEEAGLDVWWDRELAAREPYAPQIREELRAAGCVVVLWTEGALTSAWVKEEVDFAYAGGGAKNKLVSVVAADIHPDSLPAPYNSFEQHRENERDLIRRDVLAAWHGRLLLEDKQEDLPKPDARTPSMLLQAKYGLVPFTGGNETRDDLVDWALARGKYGGEPRRAAGRLIHGPGGLGKTRLLIEVAGELRKRGWSAGFLARPGSTDRIGDTPELRSERRARLARALGHLIRGATDKGLLLVMDYAEGRNEDIRRLAQEIRSRPDEDVRPIRLVLLSRGAGDWWQRLIQEDPVVAGLFGGERPDVHALAGIETGADRLAQFNAAVEAFAPKLVEMKYAMPVEAEGSPGNWAATRALAKRLEAVESNAGYDPGEGYDRPLAIAMEALLYLAAMAPGANEPGVHNLLASILGLERDHWSKLVPLRDDKGRLIQQRLTALERAVGQVTGVQGVEGRRSAEALFMADGYYAGERQSRASVGDVTDHVARIYGRGELFAQLEPDLVGEHHVGLIADEELLDACVAWIEAAPEDKVQELRTNLVTVLQRASRPEHGTAGVARAVRLLDHLILTHGAALGSAMVEVMSVTPGALFGRLEALVEDLPEDTLAAINFALPVRHTSWMEFSLRLAERYAAVSRDLLTGDDPAGELSAEHAGALFRAAAAFGALGIRLSNLGRREEALAASGEAVEIYRGLAKSRPEAFLPGLATSLNNLGAMLSNLGRLEEALAASGEAVEIYRGLATSRPEAFLPDLAMSLNNLGAMLSNLGRREEALAASGEAAEIYRGLAKSRPEAFLPNLAGSLSNLGIRLSDFGRGDEALEVSGDAVEIYRGLALSRPETFLPDLADSISNLGAMLSRLGRSEEALAASGEALQVHLGLAKARPEAFLPDLARSLRNVGGELSDLGRYEEALDVSGDAVEIYRGLAKSRPEAFLRDLATSLSSLGGHLSNLGRREEALAASDEAVQICRGLAKSRPEVFLPELATSLGALSQALLGAERYGEAAGVLREGLEAIAPFVAMHREAFGGLAEQLAQDYLSACEKAGLEPDAALLEKIAKALGLPDA